MDLKRSIQLAALFAAVFAGCVASVMMFKAHAGMAAVWPINALVLAFVLRWSDRTHERLLALSVAFAAMLLANFDTGRPWVLAVGFPIANALEIWTAVLFLRGVTVPITGTRSFLRFLAGGVVVGPVASGVVATLISTAVRTDPTPLQEFIRWVSADGLGMAIWAPFALSIDRLPKLVKWNRKDIFFGAAAQVAVLAASLLIFTPGHVPLLFLAFPFVLLAVVANRDLGGVIALAILSLVSVVATMYGMGPAKFVTDAGGNPVLVIQAFIASMVLTVYPVAALLKKLDANTAILETKRDEAEEQSRVKTRLLAHVSHEIRSPLSGVVTLAEMMKSGAMGELTPRQKDVVSRIAESGTEIEALSRDLLDAAAIQAGKATLKLQPVKVLGAVDAAANAAHFRTRDYKATLTVGEIDPTLSVIADPMRLRQILLNLMVNAAKYGGKPPLIEIRAESSGNGRVRILVADNGPGIPVERRKTMFKAFDRLGAEAGEVEGTGLGLALARELAQAQSGDLGLVDSPLGGACFYVELPSAQEAAVAA